MKNTLVLMMLFSASALFGQQQAQFSLYKFNPLTYNPAYAGTKNALSATLVHRSQWVGLEGAPMTQTLNVHSPIKDKSIGVGGGIMNDRIGSTNMTSIFADFSYQLKLNANGDKLSFGLKGGVDLFNADFWEREVHDPTDQVYLNQINNKLMPNFGFGMHYYNEDYFVGVTASRLLESSMMDQVGYEESVIARHFYLMGGYKFNINEEFDIQPSTNVKLAFNAPVSVDLNVDAIYKNKFLFGLMYRVLEGVGANFMYRFADYYNVGYGFNFSTTQLSKYNYGSHEIMFGFDMVYKDKSPSPKFF